VSLTRLSLRNFQAHARLDIDLDPLVTVLVGESDIGKSSILRALRWLCLNQPSGDAFVRHGAKGCRVTLEVDGSEVTRKRSNADNIYILHEQRYAALGVGGVPEEVQRLLSVGETNFQTQHEPSFWMFKSAGEVSRELNQIVNLGLIDSTLANLASGLKRSRTLVSLTEERLQKARGRADELSWVEQADATLQGVEARAVELASRRAQNARLHLLVADITQAGQDASQGQAGALGGARVVALGERATELGVRKRKLYHLLASLHEAEEEVSRPSPAPDFEKLSRLNDKTGEARARAGGLRVLLSDAERAEGESCRARSSLIASETELSELLVSGCPLCGRSG
jgi:DNA repair ATPase RecN